MDLMFVMRGSGSSTTNWLTAYFDGDFGVVLEEDGRPEPESCLTTTAAAGGWGEMGAEGVGGGGDGGAGCWIGASDFCSWTGGTGGEAGWGAWATEVGGVGAEGWVAGTL